MSKRKDESPQEYSARMSRYQKARRQRRQAAGKPETQPDAAPVRAQLTSDQVGEKLAHYYSSAIAREHSGYLNNLIAKRFGLDETKLAPVIGGDLHRARLPVGAKTYNEPQTAADARRLNKRKRNCTLEWVIA